MKIRSTARGSFHRVTGPIDVTRHLDGSISLRDETLGFRLFLSYEEAQSFGKFLSGFQDGAVVTETLTFTGE